jgi:hypothetical protein
MIVFRPCDHDVGFALLLAFPRATLQIVVLERVKEDLRLV